MNLLNSTVIPDLNFAQSEDEEGAAHEENRAQQRQHAVCGKKLLDSSLNNRLEPIPKHAFKPYQPPTPSPTEPQHPSFLFDFTVIEDNKALSHSSYDFIRTLNTSAQPESLGGHRMYVPVALRQQEATEAKPLDRWLDQNKEAYSEGEGELQETPQLEQKHPKNQTKNIPKNYGKAIITFIEKNKSKVIKLLEGSSVSYSEIMGEFKHRKRNINTIEHLRELWLTSKYALEMRKISHLFLRKYALQYIFNSRITNYSSHIKYRHKLLQGVTKPLQFNNIKDY